VVGRCSANQINEIVSLLHTYARVGASAKYEDDRDIQQVDVHGEEYEVNFALS